jgi:hypothetical protein
MHDGPATLYGGWGAPDLDSRLPDLNLRSPQIAGGVIGVSEGKGGGTPPFPSVTNSTLAYCGISVPQ